MLGLGRDFFVAIEYFYVATKFGQGQEYSHIATGLAKVKGIYVAIEYFYVVTEFGLDMRF